MSSQNTEPVPSEGAQVVDESAAPAESVVASDAIDIAKAKTERTLGDTAAPIKITEHASLTCNHCAQFHLNTLPEIVKNYIDTGKAYFVFSDFPLNAPALHASMIARCLPEEQYFPFLKTLFEGQSGWAFETGYLDLLKTKASGFGMSAERFDACMNSGELQTALLERMKAVQAQWNISSTPSFVINNQIVISGAMGYADFEKQLQSALEQIEQKNSAPAQKTEGE
jgi:protein-disulfide isomerase